ncbi:MAG: hypothetical protein C6P37_08575 [Caldibacillus debilis]|uniref:Uncharacterized protein n=1 Tax=Caldibacillus debilis TaxID=301148 RepID=A0A3E0K5S7_9BACI|nr:hypothetical protein [Caldibacillus debilis]REJ28684.1 MAG: hypothetical protein C6P37_08575 [Caldibacillus debilis]
MDCSGLDFMKISKALSALHKEMEKEENNEKVLAKLEEAEKELQKALYFSLDANAPFRNSVL